MPSDCSGPASRPRRPNTSSSASPATDGGRTIGRSTIASTSHLPRNVRRASTKRQRQPEDDRQDEADRGRGEAQGERGRGRPASAASTQRAVEDRPRDERRRRAAPRNRAKRPATTTPAPPPQPTGRPLAVGRAPAVGTPRLDRRRLGHEAGGRNPKSARIAWPVGSGEPVEEGLRGVRVRRRLDDDAGVGRRHVRRVGDLDRRDLVGRRRRRSRRRCRRRPRRARSWSTTAATLSSFEATFAA